MFPGLSNVIRNEPKDPVTELLKKFPGDVTFEKPLVTSSKTVSVVVKVGKDEFLGIGPNKRMAKLAAAKCAFKEEKKRNKI